MLRVSRMRIMKAEDGFTLMEVLIAVVILAVGFSILIQGYTLIMDSIEKQRDYDYLLNCIEGKLIEVANGLELSPNGYFEHDGRECRWNTVERDMEDGLSEISIKIEWSGPGSTRSYFLERIVYREEIF